MIPFKTANIHLAANSRQMPIAEYVGFAIGADSHHAELFVELDGETHFVKLGSPVLLKRPTTGAPVVSPVLRLAHQTVSAFDAGGGFTLEESRVHVLGLTCREDLEMPLPTSLRNVTGRISPAGTDTDVTVLTVPFAGRYRALFSVNGDAGRVSIFGGVSYTGLTGEAADATWSPQQEYELLAATVHLAGTVDYIVEDLDIYDVLQLRMGDATAFAPTVHYRVY